MLDRYREQVKNSHVRVNSPKRDSLRFQAICFAIGEVENIKHGKDFDRDKMSKTCAIDVAGNKVKELFIEEYRTQLECYCKYFVKPKTGK